MSIKPVKVVRDKYGFFSHPDFPAWDEGISVDIINEWFYDNGGIFVVVHFEDDADGYLVDQWFDTDFKEDVSCLTWEPTNKYEGAFLLSIHDTEDGPVAVFFRPFHVGE